MTIVLRLFHVIGGVLWVGGAALFALFLSPAVSAAGPAGGQFMQYLTQKTKIAVYLPVAGVLTVLSGMLLYWHNNSVSGGAFARSTSGMVYGIGGAAATLGLIIGGIMAGGSATELGKIGAAIAASGGPPTAEQSARIAQLRGRMRMGGNIGLVLLLTAVTCMAIGRYV